MPYFLQVNNLILLAVTKKNSNITLILFFLYKLVGVRCSTTFVGANYLPSWLQLRYSKIILASLRKRVFVIILSLFMSYSMRLWISDILKPANRRSFESKFCVCWSSFINLIIGIYLNRVITQESNRMESAPRPPIALTNAVSWRSEGIKHRKNEIFLDVIEKLNLLVSSNGTVLHSEIMGSIQMKSFLSGMPELKLGLNDKLMFEATGRSATRIKAVELEDIKFHQCVRLARFENDRTISFIPPDGEFELMSYRLSTQVKPLIWVEAVVEPHSHSRIEYMIKAKSQFKTRSIANNVEIIIPVPRDVDSPSFKASIGSVTYYPDRDAIIWTIKQFAGTKEYLMRAHFGLPSITAEDGDSWKAPIEVKFEIPYFTVSGLQVRYLKIIEKSGYQALPWVRYITMNGNYQLRMS